MRKEILLEMLDQNRTSCSFAFDRITSENFGYRLNEQSASVGFIYRHIGETMHLFGLFLGVQTDIENTTMGQEDVGQYFDLSTSRLLVNDGYEMLRRVVEGTSDAAWLEPIETPFFGTVSRVRLFAHVLYHTASHAGQISLTLSRGKAREHAD
jgi:uncharacterized damage-inducible protein DinB